MRDISYVLELWAGWARAGDSSINYSSIAAGFKGLLPQTSKMDLTCSDDDGLLIDSCIAQLKKGGLKSMIFCCNSIYVIYLNEE